MLQLNPKYNEVGTIFRLHQVDLRSEGVIENPLGSIQKGGFCGWLVLMLYKKRRKLSFLIFVVIAVILISVSASNNKAWFMSYIHYACRFGQLVEKKLGIGFWGKNLLHSIVHVDENNKNLGVVFQRVLKSWSKSCL